MNALSRGLIRELHQVLERVEREPNVRVVILTGAGKAFSSGFDLELVKLFDTTPTEEQVTSNRNRKEKGLRAALNWRDSLFRD